MAGMIQQMKQAMDLRSKMKKMQKELEKHVVEIKSNNGKITVSVRGDMTVKDIIFEPSAFEDLNIERLQKVLVTTVNSALNASKKAASAEMQKMGGLAEMLGGMGA
ncbi:MAG TPA: nucleoid-associated protein, YbaB/EbfC family [Verrucomicrobia bacterium]|nr:nucleoid-associated protein, YbaB/EbfC family [Verrucomicrobiota bacterium]